MAQVGRLATGRYNHIGREKVVARSSFGGGRIVLHAVVRWGRLYWTPDAETWFGTKREAYEAAQAFLAR